MSALSLVTTPPRLLAEVVTNFARLENSLSLAGLTSQYSSFPKSSVRPLTPAPVSAWKTTAVTPPNLALDLSGTPGTGRFLF
jgi:hypothetical protein